MMRRGHSVACVSPGDEGTNTSSQPDKDTLTFLGVRCNLAYRLRGSSIPMTTLIGALLRVKVAEPKKAVPLMECD